MFVRSLIGIVSKFTLAQKLLKAIGGALLGVSCLGWVITHLPYGDAEVVLHVMEPNVDIEIGDESFRISEMRTAPIELQLSPGSYRLIMRRGDKILYDDTYQLEGGTTRVITAWDQTVASAQSTKRILIPGMRNQR